MISTNQPVIVIPAYQPTQALPQLIQAMSQQHANLFFIIVDDGSPSSAHSIFDASSHLPNVIVLKHAVNLGKGQALKTAFNYFLLHFPHAIGIITADADGQHTAEDINHLLTLFPTQPQALWLGSRTFNHHTPLRSRLGNHLTTRVFKYIVGKKLRDTQTGLRAIPTTLIPRLLSIPSTHYEYELDMLLCAIKHHIVIKEIPIQTVYLHGNVSSHFNPIIDSLKIYFVFIRYTVVSISSALLDFFSFFVFNLLGQRLFISLIGARCISIVFNFILCKKVIFKSGNHMLFEACKYLLLATSAILLAYLLIVGLTQTIGLNLYASKIVADLCVFLINFSIQRVIVFPVDATSQP